MDARRARPIAGPIVSRRWFLALPFLPLVAARAALAQAAGRIDRTYEADVGVLFNLMTFTLRGSIVEDIDRSAGRYSVTLTGEGPAVTGRTIGTGIIRDGRFKPTTLSSVYTVRGRENRTSLAYDYDRGLVEYHSVSHTFFLGRRRQAEDVVRLQPGQQVDDLFSAELNFAADTLDRDPDGAHRITVVRRARPANEGADDVKPGGYRAELATVRFHAAPDASTGRLTARVDITGFSSWARPAQPARIAFAPNRTLEFVESSLMLGTTFTLRFTARS